MSKLQVAASIIGAEQQVIDVTLSLENEDSTPFVKSEERHYALRENLYLSNHYDIILSAALMDYGIQTGDGELEKQLGSSHYDPLKLRISKIVQTEARLTLEGSVFGDLLHMSSNFPIARLRIIGLKKKGREKLDLYQILTYEAYLLEKRSDLKLAFFTYFNAIESLISRQIDCYQKEIHSELHYALEHLSLDEKIRIAAKEALSTADLAVIAIWGEFMGTFKRVKSVRNQIAHARSAIEITPDQIEDVLFCLCSMVALFEGGAQNFQEVWQHIFNPVNDQSEQP